MITSDGTGGTTQHTIKIDKIEGSGCLHEGCHSCGGTGQKRDGGGMCVHSISCPCPKCSPRC